ncbi:MAG: flagellar protein FliS [Ignavibacteria bacterium]|nr:flagellar protein FliS [Ignavibacteria bacterium]MDP3581221.1 flagellar protein FliS [Ignavibacteria bacterium]
MQTGNYMMNKQVNKYLMNDILNASPEQVIMKIFSFAIQNCQKHDISKTNEALQVLINALNFEHPEAKEISIGFFRIYRYCQDQMRKQSYEIVYKTLTELKESWEAALAKR